MYLGGERDIFARPKFEKALQTIADGNKNVRVIRIPDAGHLPWLDEPERVVAEIERFLATQPRSGVEAVATAIDSAGREANATAAPDVDRAPLEG